MEAAMSGEVFAEQLASLGTEEPHVQAVPAHLHLAGDPARRGVVVGGLDPDVPVEVHPALAVAIVAEGLDGWLAQGRLWRSEELHARRLAILRALGTPREEALSDALNDLAISVKDGHGDFTRAKELLTESLAIRRRVLGETHPKIASSLNNLAMIHYRLSEFDRAEPLFREAVERNRPETWPCS
jgi:hypothetical protein